MKLAFLIALVFPLIVVIVSQPTSKEALVVAADKPCAVDQKSNPGGNSGSNSDTKVQKPTSIELFTLSGGGARGEFEVCKTNCKMAGGKGVTALYPSHAYTIQEFLTLDLRKKLFTDNKGAITPISDYTYWVNIKRQGSDPEVLIGGSPTSKISKDDTDFGWLAPAADKFNKIENDKAVIMYSMATSMQGVYEIDLKGAGNTHVCLCERIEE